MSSLTNRPYVGTWQLNNQGLVRVTPDALVYINGNLEVAGCPSCGGRIDLQKFITSCSVDAGIKTGANTASVTLHIPRSEGHSFFRDGQFVLRPGLEINIYFRGYFPVQGMLGGVTPEQTGGVDVRNAVMYPYYHCFHGVVTETSYEYSGGEHTASLTCSDMLHFWSYQMMSTSGSAFGARPTNSGIKFTLTGNTLNAMTPYAIIYTLYRDVMGAAGGVGFALGQQTNASATAENGQSLWSMAMLYWEKRFSQNFNSLRMYGTNGSLYNAYQQAFIGRLSTKQVEVLAKTFADPANKGGTAKDPMSDLTANTARLLGYDLASTYLSAEAQEDAEKGGFGINVAQMQAYVHDISSWSDVNLFESVYETKMNVASQVTQLSGYEFYQDVDGDFVFKPPFYNLDTSSNRVYVIKDIDLINITFTEAEPAVTTLMVKSGQFGNMAGLGLENNEWGTRGEYIDYRLVAQFGWRQDTFESAYLTNPKALFYACVSRMDLFNLDMRRAQCSIPIRPELRPGFPVYLESFDCFYYLKSFSHTFGYGGQCTTNLTLTGRRSKFYAPGIAPDDGSKPTSENIKLSNPWLPPTPLEVKGNDGVPRLQGFPNVVMALDTELVNPNYFSVGLNLTDLADDAGIKALVRKMKDYGIIEIDEELAGGKSERDKFIGGPFKVRTGRLEGKPLPTATELQIQISSFTAAYNSANGDDAKKTVSLRDIIDNRDLAVAQSADLLALLDAALSIRGTAIENGEQTSNYLDTLSSLKSSFSPGKATPGYYRYYSSSHPTPEEQGMRDLVADAETVGTTQAAGLILLESPTTVVGFPLSENKLEPITVTAGIPIMRPNTGTGGARSVPTPTHQIATLAFAQIKGRNAITVSRITSLRTPAYGKTKVLEVLRPQFTTVSQLSDDGSTVRQRFSPIYQEKVEATATLPAAVGLSGATPLILSFDEVIAKVRGSLKSDGREKKNSPVNPDQTVGDQFRGESKGLAKIAARLSTELAAVATSILKQRFKELEVLVGKYGVSKEQTEASKIANSSAYIDLSRVWAEYVLDLATDDQPATAFDDFSLGHKIAIETFNETDQYTPVFPVSDERGYEVIGSYAYGRGLSAEPGGTFQQLSETNQFEFVSVDAIDAFTEALRHTTTASKALGVVAAQDPEGAAALAAAGGVAINTQTGEGGEVISRDVLDPTKFDTAFDNFRASTMEASQKVTSTNAAYGLADLGLASTRTVCSCKGAEADVLLVAYGQQGFLSVDQPDEVSKWMADQALVAINPWKQAQNALRGQTLDISSRDLAESFDRSKGQFLSGVNAGVSDFTTATGDLEAAGQAIEDSVSSIPDSALSDAQAALDFFNPNPDEG